MSKRTTIKYTVAGRNFTVTGRIVRERHDSYSIVPLRGVEWDPTIVFKRYITEITNVETADAPTTLNNDHIN